MKLYLDTQFLDLVLEQWAKGEHDYSKVYELPIFQAFWKHQEDYLHRPLSKEKCLHDLLFIDDIDMESHKEEIVRNMNYIREIDLDMVLQHVKRYLPKECLCADRDVPIHLMIGIAGMALNDAIIMDPSPCPWFVNWQLIFCANFRWKVVPSFVKVVGMVLIFRLRKKKS